jgi:hypothetical protein
MNGDSEAWGHLRCVWEEAVVSLYVDMSTGII